MSNTQLRKENKLNRIASTNRFVYTLIMFIKIVAVLIYGVGYHIERLALRVYRLIKKLLTAGIFRTVCNIGEWVLRAFRAIWRGFLRAVTWIAGSFVGNFSWWAPAIGAVCIISVMVFSNFFSVALQVTINGSVVGYVKDENEYHAILSKVESQIQSQLNAGTTSEEEETVSDAAEAEKEEDLAEDPIVEANAETTALNLDSEAYALTTTTKYSLSLVRKSELQDEDNLYTDVYFAVSELVGTNYGLYVDGTLKAAAENKDTIQKVLDDIKKPYENTGHGDRAEFVEDVQIKKGMFAADDLKTEEELHAMFETNSDKPAYYTCQEGDYLSTIAKKFGMTHEQLKALNPDVKETEIYEGRRINIAAPDIYLRVKTIETVTYTESVPFSVKRVADSSMYTGTTKIKTEGVKGSQIVTAEITYIDGVRSGKRVVNTEVTKKPVDKVILVGSKKKRTYSYSSGSSSSGSSSYNFTQGSGVPSGSFRNPLPGCYLSCGFMGYRGHSGVDLCLRGGTLGAAVYAADGGTVEFSGWAGGYGNLIRINHGNGYSTYYGHLSSRFVSVGDRVSSGQQIGRAGSTGNSTGPHLHFEVRYNGTAYNPLNYISV